MAIDLGYTELGTPLTPDQKATVMRLAEQYTINAIRDYIGDRVKVYGTTRDGKCKSWKIGQRGGCVTVGNYW